MILMPGAGPWQRRRLFTGRWGALPGKLEAGPAAHLGVVARRAELAEAKVEDARSRFGLEKEQGRDREGLHVPHHVTVVVMIVVPGRQSEDGCRRGRRLVHRAVQIEERRIGHRLAVMIGPDQVDSPLPQVVPDLPVARPHLLETVCRRPGDKPGGLMVGLPVQGAWHDAGHLPQSIATAAPRPEAKLRPEHAVSQRVARGLELFRADKGRDVRQAAGG